MVGGPFVTYSEITGVTPTEADIERLLQPLDPRKALFLLSRMNMHFRLVRSSEGITFEQAIGNAQVFLFQAFTDEGLFEQIKIALGNTNAHERVLFHPLQILNVMCLALKYCKGTHDAENVTDEMRNAVGRCCLMMNDLLTKEVETLGLSQGSDNFRTAQAMAHLLPVFEVNNPGDMVHLLNRSLVMFNLLMSDTPTRNEILSRTGNYDFPRRFLELTKVELERLWRTAESGRPKWKDKRRFARTESCSDYRGKYLILLVKKIHKCLVAAFLRERKARFFEGLDAPGIKTTLAAGTQQVLRNL